MEPRPISFVPLGDRAYLAYFPDESSAVQFTSKLRLASPDWLEDVVPAYASVGIFFDAERIDSLQVREWLEMFDPSASPLENTTSSQLFLVPTCYEFGLDLRSACDATDLSVERVVNLHTSIEFTVHAIGFVPGFPYLGYLPPELAKTKRRASPRLRVEPGSVGLAGRQTGIYPLPRPGGWNLIGRTPLTIVDVAGGFFPIRVGDRVRFQRIDEIDFQAIDGFRIEPNKL